MEATREDWVVGGIGEAGRMKVIMAWVLGWKTWKSVRRKVLQHSRFRFLLPGENVWNGR